SLISADQPEAAKANWAAEATRRDVRSSGRRFLWPKYFVASKSTISPPSGHPSSAVLKSVMGLIALRPRHNEPCTRAGESPNGEITPAPVITTRFAINLVALAF